MKKIETDKAPKAIGPYSQAVHAGNYLFVSGQLPIDPKTGKMVADQIEIQANQVLDNIENILADIGLTFEQVVKTEIFLIDLNEFSIVNKIYGERFSHPIKPARQTFQVSKLPMNARIEISCIAYIEG